MEVLRLCFLPWIFQCVLVRADSIIHIGKRQGVGAGGGGRGGGPRRMPKNPSRGEGRGGGVSLQRHRGPRVRGKMERAELQGERLEERLGSPQAL